ncbi:MAG TPA: SGNH/GDSL hydrolase family protein [Candidatus Binatia bacterium]
MEVAVRAYTHAYIFYDVEMTRYANELKVEADSDRIGHLHRPNARLELMGVEVRTNSDGLRDDEYTKERNQKRRIIFLGDSLTLGWGVKKEETFEALLEWQLSSETPTEIINFAHGNYNTDQEVSLFLQKGLAYRPDKVVVFYFINDAEPSPRKSKWGFLGRSRFVTLFWSRLKAINARFSGKTSFKNYYSDLYSESSEGWAAAQKALQNLKTVCHERKIKVQVVLLPELHSLVNYPFVDEHKKMAAVLTEVGIPFLDLAPEFRGIENPQTLWVARDDAHPNSRAHRMIAELTRDFIGQDN